MSGNLEDELERTMKEAEEAIDNAMKGTEKALDDVADAMTRNFVETVEGSGKSTQQLIEELAAEALSQEREKWESKIAQLEFENKVLEGEVGQKHDALLRARADLENYKKRAKRDAEERVQNAIARLLEDFLPLGDNLIRARQAAEGDDQICEGIRMVEEAFYSSLSKNDIAPVISLGAVFDPAIHEAIGSRVSDAEQGIVVEEFERGYTRNGKLLRAARVVVSAGKKMMD